MVDLVDIIEDIDAQKIKQELAVSKRNSYIERVVSCCNSTAWPEVYTKERTPRQNIREEFKDRIWGYIFKLNFVLQEEFGLDASLTIRIDKIELNPEDQMGVCWYEITMRWPEDYESEGFVTVRDNVTAPLRADALMWPTMKRIVSSLEKGLLYR